MDPATDSRSTRTSQARALLVYVIAMLAVAGGTGWLVVRGLTQGKTGLPAKGASFHQVVDRDRDPAIFWMAIGVYGVLCCSTAGFAWWLAREGLRAPDGVFRQPGFRAQSNDPQENRSTHRSFQGETMTLDQARAMVAKTPSAEARAAADQLLDEAIALPQLPAHEREAAFERIRELDSVAPDYQLSSFGARVLEIIGDSLADPALRRVIYLGALELAGRYASGASSGGEGTARSMHVREIETKLNALKSGAGAPSTLESAPSAASPISRPPSRPDTPSVPAARSAQPSPQRPGFLTVVGWVFVIAGGLATPISLISMLMILGGSAGTASGSFLGGMIAIGGAPATLISGIGLLRRRYWAYGYALAVLGVFATSSGVRVLQGSTPERSTQSLNGVITTTLASSPNYPLHLLIIAIAVTLFKKLRSPAIRAEFVRSSPTGRGTTRRGQ